LFLTQLQKGEKWTLRIPIPSEEFIGTLLCATVDKGAWFGQNSNKSLGGVLMFGLASSTSLPTDKRYQDTGIYHIKSLPIEP
jgi:hypothetical protein